MGKRTRQRQLQKLAERRAAERRRQRRRRLIVQITAGVLAVGGLGVAAFAFFGGDEPSTPQAGPTPGPTTSPSPSPSPSPEALDVACGAKKPKTAKEEKTMFDQAPEMEIDPKNDYTAVLKTSCGTIELELFAKDTPKTVNNFVFLARQGFYDGLTFHRVIPGFVAQGGDPAGDGTGGPGYQFEDEIVDKLKFDEPGLLAMANSGEDTNGSQFFITTGEPTHLNGLHTIFGRVSKGTDAVTEIEALGTEAGTPTATVYIEKVTIHEA